MYPLVLVLLVIHSYVYSTHQSIILFSLVRILRMFCTYIFSSLAANDILGLDITRPDILHHQEVSRYPRVDLNTVCRTYPGLTSSQYELCSQQPDVTASAIQGIQIAVHECQFQFKNHRWNCSSLEKRNKNPHSNLLLTKGRSLRFICTEEVISI